MKKILASALAATMLLANVNAFAKVLVEKKAVYSENFDTFTKDDIRPNGTGATDSRWRFERWNPDLTWGSEIDVVDFDGKTGALKLTNTQEIIRGGKKLDNMIGGKEPYTIDLDLYVAENGQKFSLSHVGSENNGNVEDATNSYYFILWNDTADDAFADDTNIYYPQHESAWYDGSSHAYRTGYAYKTEQGENLKFKRGEWNHITIEYNNINNSNQITLTVDNTYGKQVSVPANINCSTENPLQNGLKGVSFMKWDTVGTVYMDNLVVSTPKDASEPELLDKDFAQFVTGGGNATDLDNVPAAATSMNLKFDCDLKTVKSGAVSITYGAGKKFPVSVSADGKNLEVKFEAKLLPGFTYDVEIDASKVTATSGNNMPEDKSFSFTVEDSDVGGDVVDGYVYDYYLNEDFSDFEYVPTNSSNNRKDHWGIESGNNENNADYISVETITDSLGNTMENALRLAPTENSSFSSKAIRGGRRWDSIVGADETVIIEYDIYAEESVDMCVGLLSPKALTESFNKKYYPQNAEDNAGNRILARILAKNDSYSDTSLYYGQTQNPWCPENKYMNGIEFKRNEVNHVRVEYTLGSDLTVNAGDKMVVYVSNSAGENQRANVTTYYREENENGHGAGLCGVSGITFYKWDSKGNAYIDNIKVYSMYEDVTPKVQNVEFYHSDGTTEKDVATIKPDVNKIKIKFNTAMKYAAELFDFKTKDGDDVDYVTSYEMGGSVMNIAVDDMLLPNTTYVMTIDKGATSKAGNKFDDDYEYTFKTNSEGEIIIESFEVKETVNEETGAVSYNVNTDVVKTADGKQQYTLYLVAFDAGENMLGVNYKTISYGQDEFGKKSVGTTVNFADGGEVKTVKAVLCTFPNFKVVDVKTITK